MVNIGNILAQLLILLQNFREFGLKSPGNMISSPAEGDELPAHATAVENLISMDATKPAVLIKEFDFFSSNIDHCEQRSPEIPHQEDKDASPPLLTQNEPFNFNVSACFSISSAVSVTHICAYIYIYIYICKFLKLLNC